MDCSHRAPARDASLGDSGTVDADLGVSQAVEFKYSSSRAIATGGFSDVYLGMNHDTGELICLKRPAAGFREKDIMAMEVVCSLLSLGG